jgi:hypothetical protein
VLVVLHNFFILNKWLLSAFAFGCLPRLLAIKFAISIFMNANLLRFSSRYGEMVVMSVFVTRPHTTGYPHDAFG